MSYPSSLNSQEWEKVKDYFYYKNGYGNRLVHDKRNLLNAVLYVVKTGCQWRQLPHDFPNWKTVYTFFRRLSLNGTWQKIMNDVVIACRKKAGRSEQPTFAIIDSQSVKTTGAAECRGIDGGKKIKGRKRHIVVEIMGFILAVQIHAANESDTVAGCPVFQEAAERYPSIKAVSADQGYRKTFENFVTGLGKKVTISQKDPDAWKILPKRWIVERTFSWLNSSRRLSKDYEITLHSAKSFVQIAHSVTLLRRLTES